jgi:CheY-like chemotaxis protein
MPKSILVVDNEFRSRKNIAQFLREEGYEVEEADDGVGALELLEKKNFDLLICDILMPRLSAFDVIDRMKSRSLSILIILITGHPDLLAQKGLGDLPCFTKPFNLYDLLHKVREMIGSEHLSSMSWNTLIRVAPDIRHYIDEAEDARCL